MEFINQMYEVFKSIYEFLLSVGFDIFIIIIIVAIVQAVKYIFKITPKISFLIAFSLACIYGILITISDHLTAKESFKTIIGYPAFVTLLYNAVKIFLPKLIEKFTKKDSSGEK